MSKGMSYLGYMVMNRGTSVPVSTCQEEAPGAVIGAVREIVTTVRDELQ
jgi:hypothetical protein